MVDVFSKGSWDDGHYGNQTLVSKLVCQRYFGHVALDNLLEYLNLCLTLLTGIYLVLSLERKILAKSWIPSILVILTSIPRRSEDWL